jgi:GxxExxY protein
MDLIYKDEVYDIVGAAMEVHKVLGNGFLEAVYHEALAVEFVERGIPFEMEKNIQIHYKGVLLKKYYQADFICYDKIILELKALSLLTGEHEAQLLNYLKATGFKTGLLINFGQKSLIYKRFVM